MMETEPARQDALSLEPPANQPSSATSPSAQSTGALLVLAAAVLWGTTGTAQALAPPGATPLAVGTMRLVIGGTALLAVALARGAFRHSHNWPIGPTLLAIVTIAAYQLCFFAAVVRTGVAVGTVVAISSAPVAAGLLGVIFLRERPGTPWLLATALAVAGCALLTLADGGQATLQVDALGILLAVGTGVCYAVYTIALKRLLAVQPPDAVTAVAFFGGALLLAPLLFFVDLTWLTEPRGLLVAFHLGLIATALAYLFFIRGLASVPAASAVTLALAEPLTATLLGVVVLGERLNGPALAGMALLAVGLGVLARPTRGRGSG